MEVKQKEKKEWDKRGNMPKRPSFQKCQNSETNKDYKI
jgi:hypothetical protein